MVRSEDTATASGWGVAAHPPNRLSRRTLLGQAMALAATAALVQAAGALRDRGWGTAVAAAEPDLVRDTFNGLVAFVVPGPDAYSVKQGASTPEPGGIDARTTDVLVPLFGPFAPTIADVLNGVAQQIFNPPPDPAFPSAFARLSFNQKVIGFQIMEADPSLAPLAGGLLSLAAFLAYSEAGVFNPQTRTLNGRPVGWTLSGYEGVADGRNEFKGYFQNRRAVTG